MGAACSCFCFIWRSRAAVSEKSRALGVGGWGAGPLPSHRCLSKDKYWLWTVLITSLNWAILLFPVGSLWKIHAGFRWEAAEQGWAWRAINHRRYIIHWKHVKRTRQDGPDHWKQHFHRPVHEKDRWRCVLPLGQFCYDRLTKTHSNIYWFRMFCTTRKWNVGAPFLTPGGSHPVTQKSLTCREHYYYVIQ